MFPHVYRSEKFKLGYCSGELYICKEGELNNSYVKVHPDQIDILLDTFKNWEENPPRPKTVYIDNFLLGKFTEYEIV